MQLYVTPSDEAPIYRQIVRQIVDGIARGRLRPGDRLGSHRELARDLVIAPLTVKKAYDELERDGYVHTLRGQGTFVSEPPAVDGSADEEQRQRLRERARQLASEALLASTTLKDVLALVREEHVRLTQERKQDDGENRRGRAATSSASKHRPTKKTTRKETRS